MLFMHERRHACAGRHCLVARIITIVAVAWALAGALIMLLGREAAAQQPAENRSVAILILRGEDTLVVERIQRGARTVTAVIASPGAPRVSLLYTLAPDHLIGAMSFSVHGANAAADAAPLQSGALAFTADSVLLSITGGGQTREIRRPAQPATMPIVNNDFVIAEQAVRRARAMGVTTLQVPFFALSNAQSLTGSLELFTPDSARFSLMGNVTTLALDAAGNVTGGHIAAQGLRIVVLEGAAAAAVGIGKPDYSAPAGAPYAAEEITIRTPAGHSLGGTLTLPVGASASARVPAVVTITGSGQQDRDEFLPFAGGVRIFRQVADTLGRRGIAVLRLDDRAIGGSGGDPNGTSADFADDIRAGVAYLRSRAEVDPARIALVGHSEGGMIAPMIAAEDSRLAAIVLMAGTAYTGRRIIDFQLDNSVRGDPKIPAAAKDSVIGALKAGFDSTEAHKPWMRYFLAFDPLPTIKRVRQPVLILQGETDQQVRPEEARALHAALREAGNRRVTLKLFPARNHLFLRDSVGHPTGYAALTNGKVDGEVLGTLADWLVTTLAPNAADAPSATAHPRVAWSDSLDALITSELARTGTPGAQVAVVADGKLVYSGAFGVADIESRRPVTTKTLFRVGSVTKMVTAAALTQMAAQGTLDLRAPIGRYVPELAGRRVASVTAHQLLTHSAGWLDNATAYGRMGEGALGEVFREVTDTLFFTEPGRIISYSNPGYSMAGYVAEQAGKARFADIADQLVLKRLGMPRATFRPLHALTHDFSQGHVGPAPVIVRPFTENTAQWAAGFLFASAEEMARFAIAMMDGGRLDGQQVMASEAIAMMTTGHMAMPGSENKYGYGLIVGTVNGERVWQHGGAINGFDAQVTMFPDRRVAVLVFDNRSGNGLRGVVDAAARHAAGIVPAPAPAAPPEPRDATRAERAALLGTYRNGTVRIELAEQNGALVLKQGANTAPARLVGDDRIVATPASGNPTTFLLVKDATGKVTYLHAGLRSLGRLP